jgi:hypothetical protein
MFGSGWEPAAGKIVAAEFKESSSTSGVYEYVADITPASGAPPFRATLKQPPFMSHVVRLREGETLEVLADVRRQQAKFNRDDPRVNGKHADATGRRAFDAALSQPPGTPPSA